MNQMILFLITFLTGGPGVATLGPVSLTELRSLPQEISQEADGMPPLPEPEAAKPPKRNRPERVPINFSQLTARFPLRIGDGPESVLVGFPLALAHYDRVRRIVEAELRRYPPGLLEAELDDIVIFDTLSINDVPAGGTCFETMVFVAAGNGQGGLRSDRDIALTIHHEISRILRLWRDHLIDDQRFLAANPPGFEYVADQHRAAGIDLTDSDYFRTASFYISLTDLTQGFLEPGSRLHQNQDFTNYAHALFMNPTLLLRAFAPDSAVGRKARVVRDFYLAVDPRFATVFERDPVYDDPAQVIAAPPLAQMGAAAVARRDLFDRCPLGDSYPPPKSLSDAATDPGASQLELNVLSCMTCERFGNSVESYEACMERAKEIKREYDRRRAAEAGAVQPPK